MSLIKKYYIRKFTIILALVFACSCSKELREEVTERYKDGSKKVVMKFSGTGTNEKKIEKILYDINGDIISLKNLLKNINIETIFNQNKKKIKKISFKNEKPNDVWEYYDANDGKIIGTIDFNKKTSSKISGKDASKLKDFILGEWLLESAENEDGFIIDYSKNQSEFSTKRIFFEDKILDQWKMDINGQTWKDIGIDEYQCIDIFGEDICLDNASYHNSILFDIKYPNIESIWDTHIIKGDTSKVNFYNIYNDKKIIDALKEELNEFEIKLINDSTLMMKSYSAGANTMLKYLYKKVY